MHTIESLKFSACIAIFILTRMSQTYNSQRTMALICGVKKSNIHMQMNEMESACGATYKNQLRYKI